MKTLAKCSDCDKLAVWCYMPASEHLKPHEHFACEDHVPRGCSCNLLEIDEWDGEGKVIFFNKEGEECKKEDAYFVDILDEDGRRYPCVEWMYDEEGFEIDEDEKKP